MEVIVVDQYRARCTCVVSLVSRVQPLLIKCGGEAAGLGFLYDMDGLFICSSVVIYLSPPGPA